MIIKMINKKLWIPKACDNLKEKFPSVVICLFFMLTVAFVININFSENSENKKKYPRHVPITIFTDEEAKKRFQLNGTFRPLKYTETQFKSINNKIIIDPVNGLMWQKQGAMHPCSFKEAQQYINDLNNQKFNNYNDWRLPTIDELLTLLLKKKSKQFLFIDPEFSDHQKLCWSSDIRAAKTPFGSNPNAAWGVDFSFGYVFWGKFDSQFHVRAVRGTR